MAGFALARGLVVCVASDIQSILLFDR